MPSFTLRPWFVCLALFGLTLRAYAIETGAEIAPGSRLEKAGAASELSGGTAERSRDYELIVTMPALYTTYAVRETTGTAVASRPDFHSDPDLLLRWRHQYDFFRAAASFGVRVDRYSEVVAANYETLQGRFKLALTDGKSGSFVPYVSYLGTLDYSAGFRSRDDALNDFAIGFTSGIGFDADGRRIDYLASTEPGQSSLSLDLRIGRRIADPRKFQNVFLIASIDVSYNVSETLTATLAPNFLVRRYDSYDGNPRQDVLAGILLRTAWSPEWLQKVVPRSEIGFGIAYYRNISTLRRMNYRQWELGPTVEFGYKF